MKSSSLAKSVLALLLCQVLTVTQVFAIAGGPPTGTGFGGGGTTLNLTGTYSGVLQGATESNTGGGSSNNPPPIPGDPDPVVDPDTTTGASTALGLFDLGVTQTTGLATGNFLVFADGRVFTGTIAGAVDPGSGVLKGILQGQFNFTLQTLDNAGALVSIPIAATAIGRLDAAISGATASTVTTPSTSGGLTGGTASNTLVTLSGTANLAINFGQVDSSTFEPIIARTLTFSVNGFRNSTTVTATAGFTAAAAGG